MIATLIREVAVVHRDLIRDHGPLLRVPAPGACYNLPSSLTNQLLGGAKHLFVFATTVEDSDDRHRGVDHGERDDHAPVVAGRPQPRAQVVACGASQWEACQGLAERDDRIGEVRIGEVGCILG